MGLVLTIVHVIVCFALIMIVLLQTGKGADMGAAFGAGSSQTLFGSSGASTFLTKATTGAAIVFMLTCLALAYMASHPTSGSIMRDVQAPAPAAAPATAPAEQLPAAAPEPAPPAAAPAQDAPAPQPPAQNE
jgi:preprotein translocase subunit SecG